jgi:hypothetical protein
MVLFKLDKQCFGEVFAQPVSCYFCFFFVYNPFVTSIQTLQHICIF